MLGSLRVFAVTVFCVSYLSAQLATTTALVGTVTDASGQIIPGTQIRAVNGGTGDRYEAATNDQGYYSIQFVRTGTYVITAEKQGFEKLETRDVLVETNQIVRNDLRLKIGSVTQSTVVEGSAPVIKTDDASISESLESKAVAELPLNGRDPLRLAATTPGVLPGLKSPNGTPPGQDFIGAGTREISNSLSLDGISIMNNLITTTPSRPMVEAIQEVQVQTGTYSAQYGAYMGVHINMITKSGTNQLHGALVEFVQNDKFNARNFFLSPTARKNPLRQNQFGFELDGPVIIPKLYNGRNKTFFMGSFEALRQIRSSPQLANVLTPQMFQGNFSQTTTVVKDPQTGVQFPGNIIPLSRLSPQALALQKYYPVATNPNAIFSNLNATIQSNNNTDQTVDRIDQTFGDKARVFFRYQRQDEALFAGAANPTSASTTPVYLSNFDIGYTHTFTPTIVNDLRFGRQYFNTATLNYFQTQGIANAGSSLGIAGFTADVTAANPGIPDFAINSFTGLGNASSNWYQDDKTYQGTDQISWNKGVHTIIAGLEFRKLTTGRAATNSPRGTFTFSGQYTGYAPADFLLGLPANLVTPAPQIKGVVAEWRDGFFVLDNWQATRKLTVNYGLRYELPTVPYTVNGNATELNPQQTAIVPANAPVPGFRFINPNHKNFAPRIGLAYRVTEKTVIRAGYGIYYNPNQTNSFTFLNTNPPFTTATTYTNPPTYVPAAGATAPALITLANPTAGTAGTASPTPNIITDNWNLPTAYMNQWSFTIARELWRNSGVEAEYLGSHSVHLDRSYYNNTPYLPGPGSVQSRRPNQSFGQIRTIQNDEVSSYDGLSLVLRQRFSHGLSFLASYTWAHNLDVSSDSNNGGAPLNPYNWHADYGNSNWDIRHRFVATYSYELPFFKGGNRAMHTALGGWQINGITTMQSGLPFNVTYGTDTANTSSGGANRPNAVGTATSNCGDGHLYQCINPAAFAVPAQYTYGNAGRNLLRGPHLFTTDFSLFKNFQIKERLRFEFRAEAFNVTNSPQFSNPNATFVFPVVATSSFGNITSTSVENRNIQFGGKLIW